VAQQNERPVGSLIARADFKPALFARRLIPIGMLLHNLNEGIRNVKDAATQY
jgi:hypothetical protein